MAEGVDNMFSLRGKVILITGGRGFLAEYFISALQQAGGSVISADIREGADINADVSDGKSVAAAFTEAVKKHGKLDVIVNNAAIDPKFDRSADKNDRLFENYPEELLQQSLDVNLKGYALVAQQAVKQMLKQGGGHIINISSIYGLAGPDQRLYPAGAQKPVDYAITKGGVNMLTKYLASTYGSRNIRSNTLTFGGVYKNHDVEFQEKYGERTPLGRMAQPSEVGPPLVFLASDASSYMTGANLIVDGGWTCW